MSADRDDAEIREQYQRLRQQDERLGRPLGTFLPAAGRLPRRQPYRRQAASRGDRRQLGPRLAAAALALALAAGAGALLLLRPRPVPPSQEAVIARLWRWRAPTESLLQASANQLLRGVPRLGESLIDGSFNGNLKGTLNGGNRTR
ncbi:MAG TPA: hypothetical protein VHB47_13765 [Thermoanaerobaculia bacterium]|jgi:hypothetical protein|nr:hypothetical protein [Thermoanaerobaculia bacterium]